MIIKNNIRNFCIISHVDHGKSTLADRFLEITKTVESRKMKDQYLDSMDLERERGITIKLQPVHMIWQTPWVKKYEETNKNRLLYEELICQVKKALFNVYNKLGSGFKKNTYYKVLEQELIKLKIPFEKEKIIDVCYNNKKVKKYKPDFLIDNKVIIELKALPFIKKLEKKQVWDYLKGSNFKLALLVNFGQTELQVERIIYQKNSHQDSLSSEQVVLNLIDTPGHVDFSYEVSRSLAAVEGAILLVDATQGIQAQTISNLHWAQEQNLKIIPAINKIDLPAANIKKTSQEIVSLLKIDKSEIFQISAKTGEGVKELLHAVVNKIPAPVGGKYPTRALVFDSVYDEYRGVVAFVKVVDGQITSDDKILMLGSNATDKALEVGVFKPQMTAKDNLSIGEIGYVVTGFKDISKCQVGDTLTVIKSKKQNGSEILNFESKIFLSPLPGYKKIKPMIFASIFSKDGNVKKLRNALEKLKLNDASLSYQPENSKAFGFGFRCGFLGILHMEIIKERLEREYDLNLIVTTPQVNYRKYKQNTKIKYEEPWVKLEIILPQDYIGPVMQLVQSVRGKYISIKYFTDRVLLKYEAPLSLIIANFYDKLKTVSSGFASMSYEFIGYRKEDLVKMDILITGDKVDVLSQIVHKSKINQKAHQIVKVLKELIPRQMFQISIQAAVGSKILARENIPALKKDVTQHLYGGDITRKRKLWDKQAKGKKKMKKLGKVDIPSDVFIKLLKY